MKKKKIKPCETVLYGVITADGIECDGTVYPFGWAGSKIEIRGDRWFKAALSSWKKKRVKEYIGRKVVFLMTYTHEAYNIGLIDDDGNIVKD